MNINKLDDDNDDNIDNEEEGLRGFCNCHWSFVTIVTGQLDI